MIYVYLNLCYFNEKLTCDEFSLGIRLVQLMKCICKSGTITFEIIIGKSWKQRIKTAFSKSSTLQQFCYQDICSNKKINSGKAKTKKNNVIADEQFLSVVGASRVAVHFIVEQNRYMMFIFGDSSAENELLPVEFSDSILICSAASVINQNG
ncbi:hypothetical protein T11_12892 [Trichinella zimbabwensis]|uniref:Uncharacterized protein n=1 Tax=Trichinella zimbabwensis TaxID=268475 RepID=A0A0V1I0I7_9BILA|nr:hypothetical protein T11_12892 [Trichinella zimbabwensis]